MSDYLHCDIHEMLESHLQSEQADLAEVAAPPSPAMNVRRFIG